MTEFLLLVVVIVVSLGLNWSLVVLLSFLVYVLMNVLLAAWRLNG